MTEIPSGLLTEAQPIIDQICESKSRSATFAYFLGEDIKQEVWLICMNALPKYDISKGPLPNFLRRVVGNRLKNLKRDRYFRINKNKQHSQEIQDRINIVNAIPIPVNDENQITGLGDSLLSDSPLHIMEYKELIERIKKDLPQESVKDFDDLVVGKDIGSNKKNKLYKTVIALIKAYREE